MLIVLGLGLIIHYGNQTAKSYRHLRFIQEQGFESGTAELDAIRPWMTIHFVAAAYAVPKEYIYAELDMDVSGHRRDIGLQSLNHELRLGRSPNGPYPAVIDHLKRIINDYRANPVVTGLSDLRGWMTLEYVANSSGVPAVTIVRKLRLDERAIDVSANREDTVEVSVYRPLSDLARDLRYPRGPRGLGEDIQAVIDAQPVQSP